NMSEYFRKKFNEDSSGEDWANPDEEVDQAVLTHISQKKKSKRRWLPIFLVALTAMLALVGSSSLYFNYLLLKDKNQLTHQNDFNQVQLAATNQAIQNLEKENQLKADLIQTYNKRLEKASDQETKINTSNNTIQIEKNAREKALFSKNQRLEQLNNTLRSKLNKAYSTSIECNEQHQQYQLIIDSLRTVIQTTKGNWRMDMANLMKNTANLATIAAEQLDIDDKLSEIDTVPDEIRLELKKIKKRDRFDVGYDYLFQVSKFIDQGALTFSSQFSATVSMDNSGTNKAPEIPDYSNNRLSTHAHGLTLGYSPARNLWIRSGLRFATFNINSSYQELLSYSEDQTFVNSSNGESYNNVSLTVPTPFSMTEKELEYGVSTNNPPNTGALFSYQNWSKETVDSWQIPVGFEYNINLGKRKTALYVQAGTLLNVLNIRRSTAQSMLSDADQNMLAITRETVRDQQINNRISLDTYGELGIQQTIFKGLYLRAACNYSYNVFRENESIYYPLSKHAISLRVGLGYRF
ncbi:MAG: hypothetical protein MK212_18050, partial [Saprospiraceae bacterium]|nr:hypothetical protein [Saprospiraceae bacterium]